jgi:hypothetical protein
MAEICMSLYERYCNPSADECLQSRTTTTAKLCNRLIFANLYWGFKSINLLEGNHIEIPTGVHFVGMRFGLVASVAFGGLQPPSA